MKKKVEGRKVFNIIYIIAIFAVLVSNFFSRGLSVLLYLKPDYSFSGCTEIHFINVGQGDAIAIKFSTGKVMLIDTGTSEYRKKLTNYLDNIILDGSDKIDFMLLTHIDTDHSGNAEYILENYDVDVLYRPKIYSIYEDTTSTSTCVLYDNLISIAMDKNITMIYNEAGVLLNECETSMLWLSPIDLDFNDSIDSNEYSPIIRLEYNGHSALLTGDAGISHEYDVIGCYSEDILDVDILKLGHHGSYNSTSENFLSATTPMFACVSVGENTYGHPANITLERILNYDQENNTNLFSNLYSTLEDGNVIFELGWDISVKSIANIDDYAFVSYYIYSLTAILLLAFFMLKPYIKVWKKNLRFVIQNKKFKKHLELEKQQKMQENQKE